MRDEGRVGNKGELLGICEIPGEGGLGGEK